MTARQAVLNLMREGLVDRKRGAGTFIAKNPLHRREGVLLSFSEDMKRRGLKPSSIMVSGRKEVATSEDLSALGLKNPSSVIVIKRIRLADGTPLALERVALITDCIAVLEEDLENGSLHSRLRKIGFIPTIASGWLKARLATTQEAKRLDIPSKSPLLVETRVIEDQNGVAIEFTETAYAANRYVVDIKLTCAPAVIAPFNAAPMAPA
jgi:GntR family transcriptional regulator